MMGVRALRAEPAAAALVQIAAGYLLTVVGASGGRGYGGRGDRAPHVPTRGRRRRPARVVSPVNGIQAAVGIVMKWRRAAPAMEIPRGASVRIKVRRHSTRLYTGQERVIGTRGVRRKRVVGTQVGWMWAGWRIQRRLMWWEECSMRRLLLRGKHVRGMHRGMRWRVGARGQRPVVGTVSGGESWMRRESRRRRVVPVKGRKAKRRFMSVRGRKFAPERMELSIVNIG
jgi:hypothetical protein